MDQPQINFSCPKCGNTSYEVDVFTATGGMLSKIFDVQTKKFSTVTCSRCRFTELYKTETSALGNIFDFFTD